VDGVIVEVGAPWPLGECPPVHVGQTAALDNGLWVRVAKSEVLKRLGPPTRTYGKTFIYNFDVPAHDPRAGDGAIFGRLLLEFRGERVSRLLASKATAF
jgi:hypothetical protein